MEDEQGSDEEIELLLIVLICVVVLATIIVVSMLCYFKKKHEKEFRVKNPNSQSAKGMPIADLSQTVPEHSVVIDSDHNAQAQAQ